MGISIAPTLCNHTKHHPRDAKAGKINDGNGISKLSFAKFYEEKYICSECSSREDNEGLEYIRSLLQTTYGVYSVTYSGWGAIFIPIYSAELNPLNRTKISSKQLQGIGKIKCSGISR